MTDRPDTLPIEAALAWESQALTAVARGEKARVLRVWQAAERCLVAPANMARKPAFRDAAHTSETVGWPVYLRCTGGDLTPQGPGVVNITLVTLEDREIGIDPSYDVLCEPIKRALQGFGLKPANGTLNGAFCDGRHNINIAGRKFAGTAQRRKLCPGKPGHVAILNHALMLMRPLDDATFEALHRFQTRLNPDRVLDRDAHGHLPDQLGDAQFLTRLRLAFEASERRDPSQKQKGYENDEPHRMALGG